MAKKILIVEDEPSLSKVLKLKIEELGYVVLTAADGRAALSKVKKVKPDLIVLDMLMPKKNGVEVLHELRVNLKSSVPVLILSNLEGYQDIEAGKHYGVTDYIVKSETSLRYLADRIAEILG